MRIATGVVQHSDLRRGQRVTGGLGTRMNSENPTEHGRKATDDEIAREVWDMAPRSPFVVGAFEGNCTGIWARPSETTGRHLTTVHSIT